jgi:hypothetical protein
MNRRDFFKKLGLGVAVVPMIGRGDVPVVAEEVVEKVVEKVVENYPPIPTGVFEWKQYSASIKISGKELADARGRNSMQALHNLMEERFIERKENIRRSLGGMYKGGSI